MLPFLLVIALLGGQTPPPQNAPRPPQRITPSGQTPEVMLLKGPLRVFLDCQYECDTDFIRKELYVAFGAIQVQERFCTNCQPNRPLMHRWPLVTSWSTGEVTRTMELS